ncbi:MAG: hypothetical protein JWM09_1426, partial [Francisellaceae bacterium]|nr:hypothetical protein [Francisellaceae bacterium]
MNEIVDQIINQMQKIYRANFLNSIPKLSKFIFNRINFQGYIMNEIVDQIINQM